MVSKGTSIHSAALWIIAGHAPKAGARRWLDTLTRFGCALHSLWLDPVRVPEDNIFSGDEVPSCTTFSTPTTSSASPMTCVMEPIEDYWYRQDMAAFLCSPSD